MAEPFEVTVTFTAPEDAFNSVGLTDEADGIYMSVSVDATRCEPDADASRSTDNKAEYLWYGLYDADTAFTVVYEATLDPDTPEGV